MNRCKSGLLLGIFVLLLMMPVGAQEDRPALSFALPMWMSWYIDNNPDLVADFEDEHGVRVALVETSIETTENLNLNNPEVEYPDYLDAVETLASSADVLLMNGWETFTTDVTTAGYLLDLTPLVATDDDLNIADFYPTLWESVQWDGGIWGIPASGDISLLTYDPAAFDAVGLSYPDGSWTMDDLANTIRTLTEFDAEGNMTRPVLFPGQAAMIFSAFAGVDYYDENARPAPPQINTPELISAIETWQSLYDEGYLNAQFHFSGPSRPPIITLGGMHELSDEFFVGPDGESIVREGARLPNLNAIASLSAVTVSAGTQYPELAYELAKYLADQMSEGQAFGNPARRSIRENVQAFGPELSPEDMAFVETLYAEAAPLAALRYSRYVNEAVGDMLGLNPEGTTLDPQTAVEQAEIEASENFALAQQRAADPIIVAAPPPEVVVGPGQSILNISLDEYLISSQQTEWDAFEEEFLAAHPEIAAIEIRNVAPDDDTLDCYYGDSRRLQDVDLSTLINLDPFIDTDATFATGDLLPGVEARISRDGQVWALPFVLRPSALAYDTELFAQAGVPEPTVGWTVAEFEAALQDLMNNLGLDATAGEFPIQGFGRGYGLLPLFITYGGQLWDHSTTPAQPVFTDPGNVEAIREVLDLAKDGLIEYYGRMGFGPDFAGPRPEYRPPILTAYFSPFGDQFGPGENYRVTSYPVGVNFPVDLSVEVLFIKSTATNPEACYDLARGLMSRTDFFGGMPITQGEIDSLAASGTQSQVRIDYYRQYADLLAQPEATDVSYGYTDFVETEWLTAAFNRYVTEDADLEAELQQAEAFIDEYRTCKEASGLPLGQPPRYETEAEWQDHAETTEACIAQVDPDRANERF